MVSSGYHIVLHTVRYGLLQWLSSKESAFYGVDAGDVASVPGLGRSPEGGNGNALRYSCLKNPMDRGAWWAIVHGVTKESDQTKQLNNSNIVSLDM